jgi:hypothetical protein
MEVINNDNIKSKSDFTSNEEYINYLQENDTSIVNNQLELLNLSNFTKITDLKVYLCKQFKFNRVIIDNLIKQYESESVTNSTANNIISMYGKQSYLFEYYSTLTNIKEHNKYINKKFSLTKEKRNIIKKLLDNNKIQDDKPKTKKSEEVTNSTATEKVVNKPKTKKSEKVTNSTANVETEKVVVDKPKKSEEEKVTNSTASEKVVNKPKTKKSESVTNSTATEKVVVDKPKKSEEVTNSIATELVVVDKPKKSEEEKIYNEINIKINTIQDLINLGKMYKENHNYAINLKRLHNLIPTLEEFVNVIGMENVKKTISNQIIYFLSDLDVNDDMLHTAITGPPGVGKTLLGKIISKIYYHLGIVNGNGKRYIDPITNEEKNYILKIVKRSDLIAGYLGQTAEKTQKVIDECEGGVLFIDEAYSLGNGDKYSKECIDTLNQNLTERKKDLFCIIAGYKDSLEKDFFSVNEGLRRRFPFTYNIDKYTPTELAKILMLKIEKNNWKLDNKISFDQIVEFMKINYDKFPNYGGDIETLFLKIKVAHSLRTIGNLPSVKKYLSIDDINEGLKDFIDNKSLKIDDKVRLDLYL